MSNMSNVNSGISVKSKKAPTILDEEAIFSAHTNASLQELMKKEQPLALQMIRARQDDYWNKIANYNFRVHQQEQKERMEKKK